MRAAIVLVLVVVLPFVVVLVLVVNAMNAGASTPRLGPCGGYRELVADVGLPGVFCDVIRCETAGTFDPTITNGSSTGLAQLHKASHEARAKRLGYRWPQMRQARPNLTVAADLYDEQGLVPWRFSRSCWGRRG